MGDHGTESDRSTDRREPGSAPVHTPPLIDLSGRAAPSPGPLTKPSPVVRAPRQRARWLVPVIVLAALALAGGGAIVWQMTQTGLG